MRKGFLILLAVVLVAVLAAPAMAGMDASGFLRVKGYMSNFYTGSAANPTLKADAPTNAYVEQRLRTKFSFGEENVKAVWFLETDFSAWGDQAGSTNTTTASPGGAMRNTGGALGGDRINLETKNIYIWFKLPDTSLDFTVGLQSQTDAYAGLLYGGADMAGIFMTGKMEPVTYKLGWAKLYENDTAKTDDMNLYVAEANFVPTKDMKLGVNFYYLEDFTGKVSNAAELPGGTNTIQTSLVGAAFTALNTKKIYTAGLNGTFNVGPVTLSGFGLYNWGKIEFTGGNASSRHRRQRLRARPARRHEARPREGIPRGDLHQRWRQQCQRVQVDHHALRRERVSRRELRLLPHRHVYPARQRGRHQHGAVLHRFVRCRTVAGGSRQYESRERRPRHVAHRGRL